MVKLSRRDLLYTKRSNNGIKISIIVSLKWFCDSQEIHVLDASRVKEKGLKRNKTRGGNLLLTGTVTRALQTIFHQFCNNCKIPSCTYYLKEAEMKVAMFAHFKEYHGNHKNFKSFIWFWGTLSKIRDVCMDFEPFFKVHNLVSVHPQSIIPGQVTNLNMIFHVVVSVYRLVEI